MIYIRDKKTKRIEQSMKKINLITALCIVLSLAVALPAQIFKSTRHEDKNSTFAVDYALFKTDDTTKIARLEIYYQIFNAALKFEEIDNSFEAEYEISVELYKKKKKYDSYKFSQVVRVVKKAKTKSKTDYRINQVDFLVEEGKYEVKVRLYNPVHMKEKIQKFKVKVKKYKHKRTKISDIELVQAIAPSGDNASVFDKGKLQLIPSVRHRYSTESNSSLYFYMELYQGYELEENVKVETVLRHRGKGMLYRDSLTSVFETPIVRQFRELSIDELRPGKYELIITLRGKRNRKVDTKYKDFEILWTPTALIKHDYDVLVKQIELIASSEEVKALKGKETMEERISAFNAYWEANDPTVGTFENETKNEFYRRVAVANHNFSTIFGNGWRSDQGRIFIMYGEPDQLDDFPIEQNRRPYQEWHYFHNSRYLKFIFVDVNEDGIYKLIYPYDGLNQRPSN